MNNTHNRIAEMIEDHITQTKPVAWVHNITGSLFDICPPDADEGEFLPLYPAPPQRKPLRDDQIAKIAFQEEIKWSKSPPTYEFGLAFARAIEKAHGIG